MSQPRLRVYFGPQEDSSVGTLASPAAKREQVTMSFGDVIPLLSEAIRGERTWLKDFEDDEITMSADLYEVILAYQHYRRPTG